MIEFSCIYCGQPVRVGEELARKQIDCPACGHAIRVRPPEPGEALRSSAAPSAEAASQAAERWSRMSNEEIREAILVPAMPREERWKRILKRFFSPWLPRYDDLTLFAFGLAFVMLLVVETDLRQSLIDAIVREWKNPTIIGFVIVGGGCLFCLVNVFFAREKSEFEKALMLFFAVLVTAGTGFSAGRPMLSGGFGLLALFPLWNILNGLLLLILAGLGILDEDCLTGERAGLRQILLATVSTVLLVTGCHYLFKLDPLTTFSIAVVYTMTLHNWVRRLFGWWLSPAGDS